MIVSCASKPGDATAWLFPEVRLTQRIRCPGQAAVLAGEAFERLSKELLQGALRGQTDSAADFCPDLQSPDGIFEIKGVQSRSCFRVVLDQLDRYYKLSAEQWALGKPTRIYYMFWKYRARKLCELGSTAKGIFELVFGTVEQVTIVPIQLLHTWRMMGREDKLPEGVKRLCSTWQWKRTHLQLQHHALQKAFVFPPVGFRSCLRDVHATSIDIDGERFVVPGFTLQHIMPPPELHPELVVEDLPI